MINMYISMDIHINFMILNFLAYFRRYHGRKVSLVTNAIVLFGWAKANNYPARNIALKEKLNKNRVLASINYVAQSY